MAIYVWFGQPFASPGSNISGETGAAMGDGSWLESRNSWNIAANWREEQPTGSGGWSGGGSGEGYTGEFVYLAVTGPPGGGDTVKFYTVHGSWWPGAPGASGMDWPQSECLFGGWSGAAGWYNAATTGGYVNIEVEATYFWAFSQHWDHGGVTMPYEQRRFGEWVGPQASGIAYGFRNGGLDLRAGNLSINSQKWYYGAGSSADQTRIKILGSGSSVTGDFIATGIGKYVINCDYFNNVYVDGTIARSNGTVSPTDWDGTGQDVWARGMAFNYTGHISNLCRVAGRNIDQFTYNPAWGGITAVPRMDIGPAHLAHQAGAVIIKGAVTALNFYPHHSLNETHPNHLASWMPGSSGSKQQIVSYGSNTGGNRGAWGTITLYENNPFHSITITGDIEHINNYVSFSNSAGTADNISNLVVEAGVFRTAGTNNPALRGTLNILDGVIQGGAYINLQDKHQEAIIEIAGYSGGVAGDGIFVASPNANIILPAAGNVSFNTPTTGATSAALLSTATSKG